MAEPGGWRRWMFQQRYWQGNTPWDTEVTPPELSSFLKSATPGRALDLGCGTGTNSIAMAQRGWQVTGIDFVPLAIRKAQRKAARAGVDVDFRVGDVADLSALTGSYDLALDIGCLHGLDPDRRPAYAAGLGRLLRPGANYLLYAHLPRTRQGETQGISQEQVKDLFETDFLLDRYVLGEERDAPAAWFWWRKKPASV